MFTNCFFALSAPIQTAKFFCPYSGWVPLQFELSFRWGCRTGIRNSILYNNQNMCSLNSTHTYQSLIELWAGAYRKFGMCALWEATICRSLIIREIPRDSRSAFMAHFSTLYYKRKEYMFLLKIPLLLFTIVCCWYYDGITHIPAFICICTTPFLSFILLLFHFVLMLRLNDS